MPTPTTRDQHLLAAAGHLDNAETLIDARRVLLTYLPAEQDAAALLSGLAVDLLARQADALRAAADAPVAGVVS